MLVTCSFFSPIVSVNHDVIMIALHELKSVIIDHIKVNHKFIDQNSTMWSDIAPCGQIRLPSPKRQQKGRGSIRHQQRFCLS